MYNSKEIRTRSTAKVNQTAFGKDKVVKPHIPVDPAGYWNPANWGKPVTIPSNTITGRGINQPLIGIDDIGTVKPILPGQPLIKFPGNKVTEYPMNYFDIEADDAMISEFKNGGFVVEDLPKAQDGGNQYFAYEGRPDSYYRKVNGNWQILNSSTNGKFIDIKDPKGERTKLLNAQAYPIGAEATEKLNNWKTSQTSTVNVTVPKLADLRGGVTQAPVQNIFANPAFMTSQQLQQKANSMAPTAEGAKWLEMAAAQKKNEEAQKEYADRKATQAGYDRASGAGSSSSTYVAPSYVGFQKQEEVAPSNEPLPYVMAGTDEKGNATLITQAQKQEVDQAVAKDMAINAALRDRREIEQITGKELTDEQIYGEDGQYNPNLTKYSSGDWQQKIADQRYQNFVDANQRAYDQASWYDKGASTLSNLLSDPILTIGNWTEGNTNLYGQSYMLRDELNPEAQGYARRYSNADDYWLNDWVNMINPGAIGADARVNFDQGQYGNMAGNIASLIPVSKASKIFSGVKNITPIKNVGHAAHEVLDTPLRTYLKPSSVGNAIAQSGESGLANSVLNLTPGNMLAHYSRVAAPAAWYNYSQNPTAGGFADALLLSAGVPEVWQGAAAVREGSRYIKPYAQTVKNIATGEAPLSLESFKRQDLFRFDTAPKLQQYADDYAAAIRGDKPLSATRGKYASTVENPDALMYATTTAEPTYFYRFPATQGSAKSYNIAQQYGRIEPKLASNTSLTNYEKGIRLAGERSVLPSAQFEEDLASGLYADLNLSDETIANIRKVTQNPNNYWNEPWYTGNKELQQVMSNPRFINRSEYLLPNSPNPVDFKLVTNAGDVTSSMGTSLATSMRAAAADRLAAERALANQEKKILSGKGIDKATTEEDNKITLNNPWAMPMPSLYTPSQQFLNLTTPTFQNGGSSTNPVYEGELTNDKIKELEQQGFKIEFVEKPNPINLNLPHRQEVFKRNRLTPHAFVHAFNEGDVNNLLLGAGVSGMFDTPLKQLSAGFDLNMMNITGFGKQGMLYNDFNVTPPSLRLNYNIPYTSKKKG
jgi:hypothetical protein